MYSISASDALKFVTSSYIPVKQIRDANALGNTGSAGAATSTKTVSENIRFTLEVPKTDYHLTPFLMTVPLQLLAYHVASLKNCNIDKPRNLAK